MFNPFERFQPRFIDGFRKANKRYLVSQTYTRGYNHFADEKKDYLLLTHYVDLNDASAHLNAIKNDQFAAILDLEKEQHRDKLLQMLHPDSKYVIYSSLIGDKTQVDFRANRRFDGNIRRYIAKHTNWRIGGSETIRPQMELTFGEFLVNLRWGNQTLQVKLADLEKA